jgi:hypothetical protein
LSYALQVEALENHAAMTTGIALGLVPRSTTVDAIVLASAALRGDTVYTSDVGDLERLREGVAGLRTCRSSKCELEKS